MLPKRPLVHLDLGLARTSQANPALLAIKVGPPADQAGLGMSELCQLHLQLPLVGSGTVREDVQDQLGTREHPAAQIALEVALLPGVEFVVDDEQIGFVRSEHLGELGDFAGADEPLRVGVVPTRRDHLADVDQGRTGELDGFELRFGNNGRIGRRDAFQMNLQQNRFAACFRSFKKQLCSFQARFPQRQAPA